MFNDKTDHKRNKDNFYVGEGKVIALKTPFNPALLGKMEGMNTFRF